MKKSITILMFIILLFLIPSFCSAYSLNDYEHISDLTFKDLSEFNEPVNSEFTGYINDTTLNKIVFKTSFNNVDYYIIIALPSSVPFILIDESYASVYGNTNINFMIASNYNFRNDLKTTYQGSPSLNLVGKATNTLTIDNITYTYQARNYNANFGFMDISDNIVYTNMTNFDFIYNNSIYNIDLTSTPEVPEDPEEPSGEIIDYTSKFDYIINILYLNVFLQFLLVIYYVIRSTFRID